MTSFLFFCLVVIFAALCFAELREKSTKKSKKEAVLYVVLCTAGLTVFGLYCFWKTMPSIYLILSGIFPGVLPQ